MSHREEKKRLRAHWQGQPVPSAEDRVQKSRTVCRTLLETSVVQKAEHVGLFAPLAHELDLRELWNEAPTKFVFPRIISKTEMAFFRIEKLSELTSGSFGILEPPADPTRKISIWKTCDLLLVPAVCFDRTGGRLGFGVGFYDRFLATAGRPANRWGVCFDERISSDPLPFEPHDIRMEYLATPTGLRKIGA